MKFSKRNPFVIYYHWIFNDSYPKDICTFFWGMMYAIVFSFLEIPGRLLGYVGADWPYFIRGIFAWALVFIVALIGFGYAKDQGYVLNSVWMCLLVGACVIVVFFAGLFALLFIGFSIYWAFEKWNRRNINLRTATDYSPVEHREPQVKIWWGAIRKKYCTKIEIE